jgi:hypothetical protein
MNKKMILLVVLVLVVIGAGVYMWRKNGDTPKTKEEAITQAQQYESEGACKQALTPGIHRATGAEYTFPSGCMPEGWEPTR